MNISEYWKQFTPAQRSQMMLDRIAKRKLKKSTSTKQGMSQAGRDAIRKAQQARWKKWKQQGQRIPFTTVSTTASSGESIRARLEAIEAAVAQLKADIGL